MDNILLKKYCMRISDVKVLNTSNRFSTKNVYILTKVQQLTYKCLITITCYAQKNIINSRYNKVFVVR